MCRIVIKQFEGSIPMKEVSVPLSGDRVQEAEVDEIPYRIRIRRETSDLEEYFYIRAEARQTLDMPVSLSLVFEEGCGRDAYVFMPAAVYNGNRQESRRLPYPPYCAQMGEDGWKQIITDIPHLDESGRDSCIQLLSGDMSTPAMGYFNAGTEEGVLILSNHMQNGRYTGFSVQEEANQTVFRVLAPGVREGKKYFFGELPDGSGFYPASDYPSDDEGLCQKAGEVLELEVKYFRIPAKNLYEYFCAFNELREEMERGEAFSGIPFSKAYDAVKEKYIRMNFAEEGYYRVGTENTVPPSFWQAGWVGGGMNTYPFLLEDGQTAKMQAKDTLNFIIRHLQRENGWYVPMYAGGRAYGDDFRDGDKPVLLVRKDADLLYFMVKQALYLRKDQALPEGMDESIVRQADAMVRFIGKNGEPGQFIDMEKETILVGGTGSAAILPAALALAYEYTGNAEYLKTAEEMGDWYWQNCLKRGILNGGPGEICQAPDSESAFGLLEACVQLYETTGKEKWLQASREAFELAISWVVSYDFTFPGGSAAERMGAHTRGTVFANAQNKHSAPGICTLSGNSMLKLYRFTGEKKYLEWMRRISHALSQFVSLPERPVDTLAGKPLVAGYFNERVQMSDWEGKHTVGEFLYGSNWPETAMLLTYVEIPGIYIDLDRELLSCNDHVKAQIVEKKGNELLLRIKNDTPYDARVTVLADHSMGAEKIGHLYYEKMEKIAVRSMQEITITIDGKEACNE